MKAIAAIFASSKGRGTSNGWRSCWTFKTNSFGEKYTPKVTFRRLTPPISLSSRCTSNRLEPTGTPCHGGWASSGMIWGGTSSIEHQTVTFVLNSATSKGPFVRLGWASAEILEAWSCKSSCKCKTLHLLNFIQESRCQFSCKFKRIFRFLCSVEGPCACFQFLYLPRSMLMVAIATAFQTRCIKICLKRQWLSCAEIHTRRHPLCEKRTSPVAAWKMVSPTKWSSPDSQL